MDGLAVSMGGEMKQNQGREVKKYVGMQRPTRLALGRAKDVMLFKRQNGRWPRMAEVAEIWKVRYGTAYMIWERLKASGMIPVEEEVVGAADRGKVQLVIELPVVMVRALFEFCEAGLCGRSEAIEWALGEFLEGMGLRIEDYSVMRMEDVQERMEGMVMTGKERDAG